MVCNGNLMPQINTKNLVSQLENWLKLSSMSVGASKELDVGAFKPFLLAAGLISVFTGMCSPSLMWNETRSVVGSAPGLM